MVLSPGAVTTPSSSQNLLLRNHQSRSQKTKVNKHTRISTHMSGNFIFEVARFPEKKLNVYFLFTFISKSLISSRQLWNAAAFRCLFQT